MMKKILILFSFVFIFNSCKKNGNVILFPDEDITWNSPTVSWAVVTEPYSVFRIEPYWSSATTDHCRYGDVLLIDGCSILKNEGAIKTNEVWYKFSQGWLCESSIQVYQNKYKAQEAAKKLTHK